MELLISDLEINNKNLTIENNNLIDELNEYKKDKNIEKNCFQNNLNKIINNLEILNNQYKININDNEISNIMKYQSISNFQDFIEIITNDIINLMNENKKLKKELKDLNIKLFDIEEDKKEFEKKYFNYNANHENIIRDNKSLKKQLNDFRDIINELKKTIENYNNEVKKKNIIINDINNEINIWKEKNLQLNNDNQYLLTVIMRLSKLFPNSNVYTLINQIMTCEDIPIEEKDIINDNLLCELQRCENYIKILKDNEFHATCLNQQLTNQFQELNNIKFEKNIDYNSNNYTCNDCQNNNYNYMENIKQIDPYFNKLY
jgi:chromosome segregation ATPase